MIKNLRPRFTEAGKIKLGGLGDERTSRGGGTYRVPVKYDEFVVTKTYRGPNGDLIEDEAVMEGLERDPDKKLRSIPIVLHSDDIDDVFPTSYARYAGKKLHCSGDGEKATRREITKDAKGFATYTGKDKEVPCPCDFLKDRSCKPHGTLHCSIRAKDQAVAGAIHYFRTTSIITIERIVGSLTQIKHMTGMLQGLPLVLVVQPVQVSPDGKATTVYCAHIELRAADVTTAQRAALESARLRKELVGEVADLGKSYRAMLQAPAAADESEEEQEATNAEFSPETVGDAAPAPAVEPKVTRASSIKARVGIRDAEPPHDAVTGEAVDARAAREAAWVADQEAKRLAAKAALEETLADEMKPSQSRQPGEDG